MTSLVSPGVAVSVTGGSGVAGIRAGGIIVVSAAVGRLAGVEIRSWLFCRSVCLTTVMADIVSEQWIQFRRLEQALMGVLRMPLLLDQHLSQNMPAIKLYWSKVLHQVNMLLSAVKKYHLQLQDFVRQEMEKTQLTAFYTIIVLYLFVSPKFWKNDSFTTDYAYTATDYVYIATDYAFIAKDYADIATYYAYIATDYAYIATDYAYKS
ncbi:hypothetical protein QQ045_000723 [Rhodiola kirilowii]